MRIELTREAPADWDAYVERHAAGTAYHRGAAVAIGAEAFGLWTAYLTARDAGGAVVGVLPLVEQASLLFGRYLLSLPFVTYGGILADSPAAEHALTARAAELGTERRARHVELRHRSALSIDLAQRLDKVSMVLDLPDSTAALYKGFGSKLRSQIKRAEREQPEVLWGGAELLDDFYAVFARSMRDLGTPVYSRGFFDVVCRALGPLLSVLVVRARQEARAAAIVIRHRHGIEVPWAAATPEAKRMALNMRMYAEMLELAVREGAAQFDFGRSSVDSGTYRFKAQWGAKPLQLHWHYWLRDGGEPPRLNASNPKYALASALWRRLPLLGANLLGPRIARNLP